MSSKIKRRNRRHDPGKRTRKVFSRSRCWYWESLSQVPAMNRSITQTKQGGSWMTLPPDIAAGLSKRSLNWVIAARALCQGVDGEQWVESESFAVRDAKLNDYMETYWRLRAMVLEQVKRAHVIDVGWICHTFTGAGWHGDDEVFGPFILHDLCTVTRMRANSWAMADIEIAKKQNEDRAA